ncbi:DUF4880 domain-containing protein [Roseateles sp. DAIF2]|uniref:FecR family protein n=1 Tax=Roseateles sp. DAIF2 TaxID=2714952 RepID=UPI0018A25722|nr:FecR domain-containing protein [Roseateles sp. DAIF2]QPF72397.1 DUF4880 domain-containing protein [Roseateles sp. DAIF2]
MIPPSPAPSPAPSAPDAAPLEKVALDWLVRSRSGDFGPAERQALQAWRAADPAHEEALQRWQREWSALDALPPAGVAWLKQRMALDKARAALPARRPAARRPRLALAASLLSLGLGGYLGWDLWARQPQYEHSFASARGQQLEVRLPDGSLLRLDSATRAEVALYRQRREVRLLEGQVLFQVSADPQRPFDVLAGAQRVTVLGTRFAVRHTPGVPGRDGVAVAVEEGRVQVAGLAEGAPRLRLGAGQQVLADAQGRLGPIAAVPQAGIAPWLERRLSFDNATLAEALAEFERHGPTGLRLRDPAVARLRITGSFDARRPDRFARALPEALPLRLAPIGDSLQEIRALSAAR